MVDYLTNHYNTCTYNTIDKKDINCRLAFYVTKFIVDIKSAATRKVKLKLIAFLGCYPCVSGEEGEGLLIHVCKLQDDQSQHWLQGNI